MENKKIAFLLGRVSEKGGISRVLSIISNELQNKDLFEIHIISYHEKEKFGYEWNNKLQFHHLVNDRISMKKGIFKASFKLRDILRKNNIETLICCGHIVGPLGVLGILFNKTKLIYWSHSSFKASTNNKFRLLNEKFTSFFCESIISLTKADEINYSNETFCDKVYQIYNPIDPNLLQKVRKYNSNSKKIISVGRLTHQKNFELLIDVAKIVFEKNLDYEWHIYGSGEDEIMLQKKIFQFDIQNRLILKGQANNLYSLYNDYSIMVMTSRYEGFPMSLIEGLACNLPLISFDIPTGPNEIIKDNFNGYLIEPFDKQKMAEKLLTIINDNNKRIEFSNEASNLINEFSIENIIKKWISILK